MKKSRTIILAAFGLLTSISSLTTKAQSAAIPDLGAEKSIRFIKSENNQLVFEVQLRIAQQTTLTILDDKYQELHTETINPSNFTRRYKINIDASEIVRFQLQSKRSLISETFTVTRQIEERLIVTKVK